MNTQTLLLPALITLSAISVSAAVGSWQEPGCRQRIPITLPACEAAALPVGMAIRGADFYRWTGYACPAVASIRLFTDAGPLLFQMEERDSSGQLTSQGNGRLDCDDCLVFTMELSRTPQDLYLYYDGTPASALPTGKAQA